MKEPFAETTDRVFVSRSGAAKNCTALPRQCLSLKKMLQEVALVLNRISELSQKCRQLMSTCVLKQPIHKLVSVLEMAACGGNDT